MVVKIIHIMVGLVPQMEEYYVALFPLQQVIMPPVRWKWLLWKMRLKLAGSAYIITKGNNQFSSHFTFSTPLQLQAADRVNFRIKSTNGSVTHAVISLIIELDIWCVIDWNRVNDTNANSQSS